MRKKRIAALAVSAVLALGTVTYTSYAAEGWQQSGTNWVYTDANGNKITNEWRKGADNLWRYLNGQGIMAVNSWADDDYYVDGNGIMVTNKWMKLPVKNPNWDEQNDLVWYYFSNSGKAVTDGWSKIERITWAMTALCAPPGSSCAIRGRMTIPSAMMWFPSGTTRTVTGTTF